MNNDSEINNIRENIKALTKKLDALLETRDTETIMKLSEDSISELYAEEPDLYTINDLKVRYR